MSPSERAWLRELEQRGTLSGPDGSYSSTPHAARSSPTRAPETSRGADAAVARESLKRLRDEQLLGQRGGASYRLARTLKPPAGLRLSADELDDVVAGLAADGPVGNRDVRAATGLERAEALAILDRLVREGRLRRTGERRGTKYHAA